ncbi:arsenic resistance N-acetyltransferase ArsN2 [Haloparvum sp. PAK95]|uniref:arsenic resistance N-acetyltransferase ArsN2 n=1 Tax=Haloparvum sp. PAK95 TaxID=3418962 RepID=UPI003D2EA283
MTGRSVQLEPAAGSDLDDVRSLLRANDLPAADVGANADSIYRVIDEGDLVGLGGVERYGTVGLLRSVVVTEANRGEGYGTAICDALEAQARSTGVETLFLLTTTATEFFRERGYEPAERTAVPESIRQTNEFTDLCPETAACLRKDLAEKRDGDRFGSTPP